MFPKNEKIFTVPKAIFLCLVLFLFTFAYLNFIFVSSLIFPYYIQNSDLAQKVKNTAASKRYCVGFWLSSIYQLSSVRLYQKRSYSRSEMHIGCALKVLLSLTHTFFYNLESRAEADIVSAVDIVNCNISVMFS